MHYILRQIVPNDIDVPIEIHVTEDELQIGRKSIVTLAKFPQISRIHAILLKADNGTLYLKDLNSTNGCFVNNEKIGKSIKSLSLGDVVGFGVTCEQIDVGFVGRLVTSDLPNGVKQENIELSNNNEENGTCVESSVNSDIQMPNCSFQSPALNSDFESDSSSSKQFLFSVPSVSSRFESDVIVVKHCFVPLVKCDSEHFKWPSDVKNPFKVKDNVFVNSKKFKRAKKQSSNSENIDNNLDAQINFSHCINHNLIKNQSSNYHQKTNDSQNSTKTTNKKKRDSSCFLEERANNSKLFKKESFNSNSNGRTTVIQTVKRELHLHNLNDCEEITILSDDESEFKVPQFFNPAARNQPIGSSVSNISMQIVESKNDLCKNKDLEEECPVHTNSIAKNKGSPNVCNKDFKASEKTINLPPSSVNQKEVLRSQTSHSKTNSDNKFIDYPKFLHQNAENYLQDEEIFILSDDESCSKSFNPKLEQREEGRLSINFDKTRKSHKGNSSINDSTLCIIESEPSKSNSGQINYLSKQVENNSFCSINHLSAIKVAQMGDQNFSETKIKIKNSSDDEDFQACGEVNYSQVEEIIIISDDESYYDFKSSQTYVHIKQEPEEISEDICDQIFENEELEHPLYSSESNSFAPHTTDKSDKVESIEAIQAFMNSSLNEGDIIKPTVLTHGSDLKNIGNEGLLNECSLDENISNYIVIPCILENKCADKHRQAKLIDPRPMKSKSRKEKVLKKKRKPFDSKSCISKSTVDINKKKQLYKDIDNSHLKLSTFKIPRKPQENIVNSQEKISDVSEKSSNSGKNIKKSTVKRWPDKSTSRMSFLTDEVETKKPSNKREIKHRASKDIKITDPNLTKKQEKCDKEKSLTQKESVPVVSLKNSATSITSPSEHPKTESFSQNIPSVSKDTSISFSNGKSSTQNTFTSDSLQSNQLFENPVEIMLSNKRIHKGYIAASSHQSNASVQNKIASNNLNNNLPVPKNFNSGISQFNSRDPRQNRAKYLQSQYNQDMLRSLKIVKTGGQANETKSVPARFEAADKYIKNYNNDDNNQNSRFRNNTAVTGKTEKQCSTNFANLSFNLIKDIIQLNVVWLQEQSKMKSPPPLVSKGAFDLPLSYKSYEKYVSSLYPMLLLEIWEQMYVESKEIFASNKKYKKFYFSILTYVSKDDYVELKCESVVNEKVCFGPREGFLTILELQEGSTRLSPGFGYIFNHRIESLNLNYVKCSDWKKLNQDWLENAKMWRFTAYIKKKQMTFKLNSLMKGSGLCYIKNKLRLADALNYVRNSPLLTDILQPRWASFEVKYCAPPQSYILKDFNSCQKEVIKGISDEINKPQRNSKIVLLQGPPGTGKTHTIIGLIEKLLSMHTYSSNYRILVTAPSNAAVDEIGCRLIELNKKLNREFHEARFVRVGIEDQVHESIKPYFIENRAKDAFELDMLISNQQKEKDIQRLLSDIQRAEKKPKTSDTITELSYLREKYKILSTNSSNTAYHDMKYKIKILKDSLIVLSTLSSCGLSLLLKTFKPNSVFQFSCCIIDESTQCTELEILQPLVLGINKLILVGDHQQLPATVLSKMACECGFEKSAFERFHLFFTRSYKKTPMYTLSEQFRMHSAICDFPAKHFYDRKLVTSQYTNEKYKNFPLCPYILLDILISQESSNASSIYNCEEASVIVNICSYLQNIVDSASSIGIITPYQAQRSLYVNALRSNTWYKEIEVNTVDGFQGREKDIIILSSVRANSQSGSIGFLASRQRLNVAITRARKCLIICAHTSSLMNNPDWRALILDAKERNLCIGVTSPKDIPMLFKEHVKKHL